ncbi:MAG: substrate-binding periplasmic protein [Cellvibrionaceae bacterium]
MNTFFPTNICGQWLALCFLTVFTALATAENSTEPRPLTIITNTWAPYITDEQTPLGTAASIVDLIATEMDAEVHWRYVSYDLSYQLIKRNRAKLAFPFFKTPARAEEVIFSDPVFSATSHLYYNLQFLTREQSRADLSSLRIGRVSGYSYGQSIDQLLDQAVVFGSEKSALQALFNRQIDLLPMTDGVMAHTLHSAFPERIQLIRQREDIRDQSSLHMIAPKTENGQKTIAAFNQALAKLRALSIESIEVVPAQLPVPLDLAQLITAEGYPAILGQTSNLTSSSQYFTLPQGTRVIVIEWSDRIVEPSSTDRFYKNMMDLSRVVVLNGPHVGKELFVRNMHIELL